MQKNKIISFTILLSFILTTNSNLFSENENKNTNINQNQQQKQTLKEESFWQQHKVAIITASTITTLLVAYVTVLCLKNNKNKYVKNVFEQGEVQENVDKDGTIHLTFVGNSSKKDVNAELIAQQEQDTALLNEQQKRRRANLLQAQNKAREELIKQQEGKKEEKTKELYETQRKRMQELKERQKQEEECLLQEQSEKEADFYKKQAQERLRLYKEVEEAGLRNLAKAKKIARDLEDQIFASK